MPRNPQTWAFRYETPTGRGQATIMVALNSSEPEVRQALASMMPKAQITYIGYLGEDK